MQKLFEYSFPALGSINQIKIFSETEEFSNKISELVIAEVKTIEAKFSRYQSKSIISQINAAAGQDPILVDAETSALLDYADQCFKESGGLFDITSGILRRVWDFKVQKIPEQKSIESLLGLIGWNQVQWNNPYFHLPKIGMEIDFGGIGKEFAVDRCAALCLEAGVKSGFVNLGGDLRVLGPRPDGSAWIIGLQHPRQKDKILNYVKLFKGALATSGDYERFIEVNGKRYCHILNPKTGWPVSDLQSVTIFGESCLVSGSLATITMLYGEKRGSLLLKNNQVPHLLVDCEGKCKVFPSSD
ncbi:MAG: FAD:protein FMN transferase [bacterium]|nr:FAD:protein FMN transferase [bacterium]